MIELEQWLLDAFAKNKGKNIEVSGEITYTDEEIHGLLSDIDLQESEDLHFCIETSDGAQFWCKHIRPYEEPVKKWVPWTAENCPLSCGDVLRHKTTRKRISMITGCDFDDSICNVYISAGNDDYWFSFQELFEKFVMLDGSPCGAETDDEK